MRDAGMFLLIVVSQICVLHQVKAQGDYYFNFVGCYADQTTPRRDLQHVGPVTSSMTLQTCVNYCGSMSYRYAGTQNANSCFCDNSYGYYGTSTTCTSSGSWTKCPGDVLYGITICGSTTANTVMEVVGTNRNVSGPSFVMTGCYTDSTSARILPDYYSVSPMTLNACAFYCAQHSYVYAGGELGNECWCGNTPPDPALIAVSPVAGCNYMCSGDHGVLCGGNSYITILFVGSAPAKTTTPGTTTKSTTIVATTKSPTTTTPATTTMSPTTTSLLTTTTPLTTTAPMTTTTPETTTHAWTTAPIASTGTPSLHHPSNAGSLLFRNVLRDAYLESGHLDGVINPRCDDLFCARMCLIDQLCVGFNMFSRYPKSGSMFGRCACELQSNLNIFNSSRAAVSQSGANHWQVRD